jgi:hypothetical protein
MKRFIPTLLLAGCLCSAWAVCADKEGEHKDGHVILAPDKLQWKPHPALPSGAQAAVLSGDPAKAGSLYAVRVKVPDGYKVPPHWHPTDENVTVLQGSLLIGTGDKFDQAKMQPVPTGGFMRMPKEMRHFAMAKGEAIIQVHGVGPFEINYVNPADDPRKK